MAPGQEASSADFISSLLMCIKSLPMQQLKTTHRDFQATPAGREQEVAQGRGVLTQSLPRLPSSCGPVLSSKSEAGAGGAPNTAHSQGGFGTPRFLTGCGQQALGCDIILAPGTDLWHWRH